MSDLALAIAIVVPAVVLLRIAGSWMIRKGTEIERGHGRHFDRSEDLPKQPDVPKQPNPFGD